MLPIKLIQSVIPPNEPSEAVRCAHSATNGSVVRKSLLKTKAEKKEKKFTPTASVIPIRRPAVIGLN